MFFGIFLNVLGRWMGRRELGWVGLVRENGMMEEWEDRKMGAMGEIGGKIYSIERKSREGEDIT